MVTSHLCWQLATTDRQSHSADLDGECLLNSQSSKYPPKKLAQKVGQTAPADPRCSSQLQANTQSHIWFLCTTRNASIVIRHSLPPGLCCLASLRTSCGRGGGEGSGHASTFKLSLGWNADLTNQNSCLKMTSWKLFLSRLSVPLTTRYGKSLCYSMLPLS